MGESRATRFAIAREVTTMREATTAALVVINQPLTPSSQSIIKFGAAILIHLDMIQAT